VNHYLVNKKMTKKEHTIKREDLTGVWTGFIVVTIVMIALCFFPFQGWQFWMIFPIAGTLIGAVTTTIQFYTAGRMKCSNCGTTLEGDVEFCKVCGVRIITKCPSCNCSKSFWK
jgi:RNA polymerase subunit RPABC4/transcription elongation factor Spt4